MSVNLDCGDNSCVFAPKENRGGMRTNGGCRCLENAGYHRSAIAAAYQMLPELLSLKAKLREVPWTEEELEKEFNENIRYVAEDWGIVQRIINWAEKRIKERGL